MDKNVGSADQIIRVVVGMVLVAAGVIFQSWWGLVGLVPLFTASIGWCPAYFPFGIKTCKTAN
ncbi:MAG: DUF2892 domain-containing protein [SAR324 cluster bacterium]|nr:DUF2892 domain-containing protein [SAR324 cluster bacterium]MBL7035658.1 DUF2892 domain-containing protein [SAR324 cluster bacterium]